MLLWLLCMLTTTSIVYLLSEWIVHRRAGAHHTRRQRGATRESVLGHGFGYHGREIVPLATVTATDRPAVHMLAVHGLPRLLRINGHLRPLLRLRLLLPTTHRPLLMGHLQWSRRLLVVLLRRLLVVLRWVVALGLLPLPATHSLLLLIVIWLLLWVLVLRRRLRLVLVLRGWLLALRPRCFLFLGSVHLAVASGWSHSGLRTMSLRLRSGRRNSPLRRWGQRGVLRLRVTEFKCRATALSARRRTATARRLPLAAVCALRVAVAVSLAVGCLATLHPGLEVT